MKSRQWHLPLNHANQHLPGQVQVAWLIVILALATLTRLYGSTASAIWCDEGSSLLMSQYSPALIWSHSAHDVHPPLYFWLLHGWIKLFGDGIFSIRFLSVLPGIGSVALGIWLVARIATPRAALLTGLLLALLPIAVRYSQEVRMYSLLGLLLLGATLALVYWVQNPGRHRYLVIYSLLMAAGFYTHYFTGLCVLSHWLYLTLVRHEQRRLVWRPDWWIANVMIVLIYTPWIPNIVDLFRHLDELKAGGDIGWIPAMTAYTLPSTLWQYFTLSDGRQLSGPLYIALPLGLLALTIMACVQDRTPQRFYSLIAIYTFLPLLVIFLVSWLTPVLVDRYLMFSALGLPMIVALAADRLARFSRYAAFFILLAVTAIELQGLRNDYQTDSLQFDALVEHVNERYVANDRIVVSDLFWYFSFVYYNRTGATPLLYTPPDSNGVSTRPNDYGFGTLVNGKARSIYLDDLQLLGDGPGRVWLISGSAPPDDFPSIPANWKKVATFNTGDVLARLYVIP